MTVAENHLDAHVKRQEAILTEFLTLAPFQGWGEDTLATAAQYACGDAVWAGVAFPEGVAELTDFFQGFLAKQLETIRNQKDTEFLALRTTARIRWLLVARMNLLAPHKEAIRALMAYYSRPLHSVQGAKHLAQAASQMWYLAGDKALDISFYTKRGILSGVYSATLLYWLGQADENPQELQAFIDRRLRNVMQFHQFRHGVEEKLRKPLQWLRTRRA